MASRQVFGVSAHASRRQLGPPHPWPELLVAVLVVVADCPVAVDVYICVCDWNQRDMGNGGGQGILGGGGGGGRRCRAAAGVERAAMV